MLEAHFHSRLSSGQLMQLSELLNEYNPETNTIKYATLVSNDHTALIDVLLNVFYILDIDQDERVSLEELREALLTVERHCHLDVKNVCKRLVSEFDSKATAVNSNRVSAKEFRQLVLDVVDVDILVGQLNQDVGPEEEDNLSGSVSESESEEHEDGEDSKSLNSESSEDGPLQLVRL